MPSSTSNFKRKLRLPRLFFAKPSEIVHRDYERPIPQLPWRGITVVVVLVAGELWAKQTPVRPQVNATMARMRIFMGPGA